LSGTLDAAATTPLPDTRLEFFAGDWIGTGVEDSFCFMRLLKDGSGTVLVSGASGDWLGATIRWRNERQVLKLVDAVPLPADPRRRLMALPSLTLSSGLNQTVRLGWQGRSSTCELQLRGAVSRRENEALALLQPSQAALRHGAN
jgi:hypothetical protein